MDKHNPIVSVCCLVYNHEPFLRECFEGFVMQQTTFPIEILVHDDASTDHSADIIREYTEKYSDLFKPIYQTENQYSKGNGFVGVSLNLERAKGKYIAMCEGDDYWTDPLKLQKQVDFLEANPDFSVCFHNSAERYGNDIVQPVVDNEKIECSDIYELAKGNVIYTASVLYRSNRNAIKDFLNFRNLPATDYVCHLLFAQFGKIAKLPQTMSVYRNGVGIWSRLSYIDMRYEETIMLMALLDFFVHRNDRVYKLLDRQIRKRFETVYNFAKKESNEKEILLHSKSYRLGHMLLYPLRIIFNKD